VSEAFWNLGEEYWDGNGFLLMESRLLYVWAGAWWIRAEGREHAWLLLVLAGPLVTLSCAMWLW